MALRKALLAALAIWAVVVAADVDCMNDAQTSPSDIAACADQLAQRGNEACTVAGGHHTEFYRIGSASIVGVGVGAGRVDTSSPCVDIAIAVGHILDACTHDVAGIGLKSGGQTDSNNNGDIRFHALAA